jgi:hypothetical protein
MFGRRYSLWRAGLPGDFVLVLIFGYSIVDL